MSSNESSASNPSKAVKPLTTSLPDLLIDGTDATFRQFMHDFFSVAKNIEAGRAELARVIDVTPPQYSMIMAIWAHEKQGGITIGELAALLHVHSPYVVLQIRALVERDIVRREPKPEDARSVLLYLTEEGRSLVAKVSPLVRLANDMGFESVSTTDLRRLARIFSVLAVNIPAANQALRLARKHLQQP